MNPECFVLCLHFVFISIPCKDCIKSLCDNLFMSSSIIRTSYFDNRLAGCLFSSAGYVYAMLCFHFNSKASTQCKYNFIGYKILLTLAGDFEKELVT